MKRIINWLLIGVLIILAGFFSATSASASNGLKSVSSVAALAPNDLVIANDRRSVTSLRVCQNWGSTTCSSGVRYLPPNANTKTRFGWKDADGFYVAKGTKVRIGRTYYHKVGWTKASGRFGLTASYQIYRLN